MKTFTKAELARLYSPPPGSHKGNNGRLLIVGGSHLFHAASIWSLTVASRLVDLVHYASVPENNELVLRLKQEFRNGIVIQRQDVAAYIREDDCILMGPGMVRTHDAAALSAAGAVTQLAQVDTLPDEGAQTAAITRLLLTTFPDKQWVLDAGALQMLQLGDIPPRAILTPHHGEFETLWQKQLDRQPEDGGVTELAAQVQRIAAVCRCIVLVKGAEDVVSDGTDTWRIAGGNAGMTKGGTGDVLAGLIAGLACKNDPLLATLAGSLINKQAGDDLFTTVGPFFNATDLANRIPVTMHALLSAAH